MRPTSLFTYTAFALLAVGCTENRLPVAPTAPSLSVAQDTNADRRYGKAHVPQQRVVHGRDGNPTPSQRGEMYYHGGSIMVSNVTYAIFNGPDWQVNSAFTGDKITSIESFLSGLGGSNIGVPGSHYADLLTEYFDSHDNYISSTSNYLGRIVDNGTPLSANASAQTVATYVCSQLAANGIAPREDAVYVVFTEDPLTTQPFYAWHSDAQNQCGGSHIHFAFVLNVDGKNWVTDGVYHSSDAALLVNAVAHELFETVTDPSGGSWFATNTAGEIADKCNFVFNGYVTLLNGDHFKVQTQWSNTAFEHGEGVPNYYGERGCMTIRAVVPYISGPSSTSDGGTYTWTASGAGGVDGQYTYQWVVDYDSGTHYVGGTGSSQSLTVHASDGNFTISVTVASGGYSATASQGVSNGCSQNWQNNVYYYEGDIVCYGSQAFQSTLEANIGNVPYDGSPYWTLIQ
jgi:hypothetical protein